MSINLGDRLLNAFALTNAAAVACDLDDLRADANLRAMASSTGSELPLSLVRTLADDDLSKCT